MDTAYEDDEDDLPEGTVRSSEVNHLVNQRVEELLRTSTQAARSIFEREQKTDILSGLIMTLTNRAMKATARAGRVTGYNQKLQEELKRQLEVQSRFTDLVAWYERITQIVVGGTLSKDRYDDGPHANGIRCERCHRQVEEIRVVEHLMQHKADDDHEAAVQREADRIRYERSEQAAQAAEQMATPKPRRSRKK